MSSLPYFFVDTKRRVRKFRENVGVSLLFWATIKKNRSRFIVNVQVTHYNAIFYHCVLATDKETDESWDISMI